MENKNITSLIPIDLPSLELANKSISITNKIIIESVEQELFNWWNSLSNNWQRIFLLQIGENNSNISYNNLKRIIQLNNLSCSNIKMENDIFTSFTPEIYDLAPIIRLKDLKVFSCCNKGIKDINELSHLTQLEELWLSWSNVEDLTPLVGLECLKELYLQGTKVKSIKPLMMIQSLKYLSLREVFLTTSEVEEFKFMNPDCKIAL
jgi:hypothetical protein